MLRNPWKIETTTRNNPGTKGIPFRKDTEVLNGGYNVHPVPPPNSEKQERIMKRYETKRIKIEKL